MSDDEDEQSIDVDDEAPPANLIEIRKGVTVPEGMPDVDTSPLQHTRPTTDPCKHLQVWLDVKTRWITCQRCGAVVDAFDFLLKLSGEWTRYATWVLHARYERKRIATEIERMKEEKHRLQGKVGRLRKKAGLPNVSDCHRCSLWRQGHPTPCPLHGVVEGKA